MNVWRQPGPLYIKKDASKRGRRTGQDRRNLFYTRQETEGKAITGPRGEPATATETLLNVRCRETVIAQVVRWQTSPPHLRLLVPGAEVMLRWFDSGGFGFDIDAYAWQQQMPKGAVRGDRVLIDPALIVIGCRWHGAATDESGHRVDVAMVRQQLDLLRPTAAHQRSVDVLRVVSVEPA